jgi:hypothetical protein
MIQHPRYLNATNPIRPYVDVFNTKSVYTSGSNKTALYALTDEQIELLIKAESDDYSKPDIHADLAGDDYADAMMAELGIN